MTRIYIVLLVAFHSCSRPVKTEKIKIETSVDKTENKLDQTKIETLKFKEDPNLSAENEGRWIVDPSTQIVKVVFIENFEDGNFADSGKCHGNCPELKRDVVTSNTYLEATLNSESIEPFRTELNLRQSADLEMTGKTYVFGFRVRFHQDVGSDFPRSMFVQTHAKNWLESSKNKQDYWQSFVGRISDSGSLTGLWQGERINGEKVAKNFTCIPEKWYECHVLLRLRNDSTGCIMVFRDGKLEYSEFGSNSGNWVHAQYLNVGIYTGKSRKVPNGASRSVDYDDLMLYDISQLFPDTKDLRGFGLQMLQ